MSVPWSDLRELFLELDLTTEEAAEALGLSVHDFCLITNGQLLEYDCTKALRRLREYAAERRPRSGTEGDPRLTGRSRIAEDGTTEYEVRVNAGISPTELLMWVRFATEPAPPLRVTYRDGEEP